MSGVDTIREALKLAPQVVEHVVSLIDHKGSVGGERVGGSKDAPVPFNLQAFNDVNEVYQRLVSWSVFVAGKIGVQAPGPAVRAWRAINGTVVGLPYDITPAGARYVSGVMAAWLGLHLSEAVACVPADDLAYFADEMKDVFRVNARWPQTAQPYFSKLPCPTDGGQVAVFPPDKFEGDVRVVCEGCGRIFSDGEFTELVRERATAAKVVAHLGRKYLKGA